VRGVQIEQGSKFIQCVSHLVYLHEVCNAVALSLSLSIYIYCIL